MANGIRKGNPWGFNKGCSLKFCEVSRVQQTPEEGRRTYQLKHWGNNNKDEDNSLKTLNDKNLFFLFLENWKRIRWSEGPHILNNIQIALCEQTVIDRFEQS